jgi:hypothetical protein
MFRQITLFLPQLVAAIFLQKSYNVIKIDVITGQLTTYVNDRDVVVIQNV